MSDMQVDPRTVERVRKLLNLARDGGATEAEAALAMERAQAIMLDNNLSMAVVELSTGTAAEKRTKDGTEKRANYRWQRVLMEAIAKSSFCALRTLTEQRRIRGDRLRDLATGYELIGRISNVTSARQMYEYLLQTAARLRRDYEEQIEIEAKKQGALFVEGLAARLAERIETRHEEQLRAQAEEAERQRREQAARSTHPGAAPTGNSLVVVLTDYAQQEADLNNDLMHGWEAGTTARKRAEAEAAAVKRQQEWDERERKVAELVKQGVDREVAWDMMHLGWSRERAEAYEAQRRAEREAEAKSGTKARGGWRGGKTREERLHDRLYTHSARQGRRAADNVSLDKQVGRGETRRIK